MTEEMKTFFNCIAAAGQSLSNSGVQEEDDRQTAEEKQVRVSNCK